MRFMMLVRANKDTEAGVLPSRELVAAMGTFNEEMAKAGVLLAGEGLHASSKGARIQVRSKKEAIEWASRVPFADGEVIEIRQVVEASDFPPEIFPPEDRAREEALREELQRRAGKPTGGA